MIKTSCRISRFVKKICCPRSSLWGSQNQKCWSPFCSYNYNLSTTAGTTIEETAEKEQEKIKVPAYLEPNKLLRENEKLLHQLVDTMTVEVNFVQPHQEECLLREIEPYMKFMQYEKDHWDNAIHGYRETEFPNWNLEENQKVIERVRDFIKKFDGGPQIKFIHVLDLAKEGVIKPHIDSVRFCGNVIAGISLLTDCVMRLKYEDEPALSCDVFLPRYSLYIMRDIARYKFTHEILEGKESKFLGKEIFKDRRISVICRSEVKNEVQP